MPHLDEKPEPKKLYQFAAVAADEDNVRLDRWFKRHFPGIPHAYLQKMLRKGHIRIDGKKAEASTRLRVGQDIRMPASLASGAALRHGDGVAATHHEKAAQLKKLVLYEDDDVIAFNKPAGLAVQGGTGLKESIDGLLGFFSRTGHNKPKLVHRLDRETSGVLLVARSDFAAAKLAASFRHRDTQKIYWAVTLGVPRPSKGRINVPLIKRGEKMAVAEEGADEEGFSVKSADTLYQVVDSVSGKAAFVALWPLTGRTHQLRLHLAHVGTPILGDRLYGEEALEGVPAKEIGKGLHLHARRLVVPHPRGGLIDITAPLGKEMAKTFSWFGFELDKESCFYDSWL